MRDGRRIRRNPLCILFLDEREGEEDDVKKNIDKVDRLFIILYTYDESPIRGSGLHQFQINLSLYRSYQGLNY